MSAFGFSGSGAEEEPEGWGRGTTDCCCAPKPREVSGWWCRPFGTFEAAAASAARLGRVRPHRARPCRVGFREMPCVVVVPLPHKFCERQGTAAEVIHTIKARQVRPCVSRKPQLSSSLLLMKVRAKTHQLLFRSWPRRKSGCCDSF